METLDNLIELWPKVKPILLPYEGAASQVYVLGVPLRELERVINVFCRKTKSAQINTLDGYTFPEGKELECDIVNRVEVLKASSESIILGKFSGEKSIQFWIWPDKTQATFDAEFVFFAEDLFGENETDDELRASFSRIYSLAEMARINNQVSECVLSGSETGDPRKERDEDWTVFW